MSPEAIALIVSAIFGGGGIFALFKVRAESGQIIVHAAETVVQMQAKEMKRLSDSNRRLERALRKEQQERAIDAKNCKAQIDQLNQRLTDCLERVEGNRG